MRFDILERLLEVDRRASQVSLLHEEKARRAAANAASIPSRSMSGSLASSSPVAGSRTSRVLRAPTLFPSIGFAKVPRTPAAARALSRLATTQPAEPAPTTKTSKAFMTTSIQTINDIGIDLDDG